VLFSEMSKLIEERLLHHLLTNSFEIKHIPYIIY